MQNQQQQVTARAAAGELMTQDDVLATIENCQT
jgi:hypothetical protein